MWVVQYSIMLSLFINCLSLINNFSVKKNCTEKPFIFNSVKENKDRNLNIFFDEETEKIFFTVLSCFGTNKNCAFFNSD